ncbi:MAG: exodeoxyribonuclease III [Bacteriovoracaceae bacterium]
MKKLVSWNVNGIRAVSKKGFVDWLNKDQPNIVCLQEIKAARDQFPKEILEHEKYHTYIKSADRRGYSGVCVMTREKPNKVIDQIGIDKFDNEGRSLILEFDDFALINCYFPNGGRDHSRVDFKLEFYQAILELYNEYRERGQNVILTGDFNTSHQDIDLANPKSNKNSTGFLPREREWIDIYLKAGLVDCFRELYPEDTGEYTWWTYRNDCRGRNIGWRLDYFMTNKEFMPKVQGCAHRAEVMGSDHCPVEILIKS